VSLLKDSERAIVGAVAALADCNPFLPERIDLERRALGRAFSGGGMVWHADADLAVAGPNNDKLRTLVERLGNDLRGRLAKRTRATAGELADYQGLIRYLLFQRYEDDWYALFVPTGVRPARRKRVAAFGRFARDVEHFLRIPGRALALEGDTAHLFALGFQARRAFHHIFRQIFGSSMPAARLRAAVWQSIFTHDPHSYRHALYAKMGDIPTLIIGESGTGKELVARAIALSRYIPFDARARAFVANSADTMQAVSLAALTPTLIESELFGHRRGAFTGAIDDRIGWLETCGPYGCVFLDEIGELDLAIQVKLLRVLQTRVFQRIGETRPRRFAGKVIAATNRNLDEEIAAGRFRSDLYFRIYADLIRTPTLREQLADAPGDLRMLALIVARQVIGNEQEADRLAGEVEDWVRGHLGTDFDWPGNVRELEQCVRSVLIRGTYFPLQRSRDEGSELVESMRRGASTAEQILQLYCTLVYGQTRSYQEAARRLGLDRRTVKAKVDAQAMRNGGKDEESPE
jgi:transcriptional regulator with AAA-type ATPase domain